MRMQQLTWVVCCILQFLRISWPWGELALDSGPFGSSWALKGTQNQGPLIQFTLNRKPSGDPCTSALQIHCIINQLVYPIKWTSLWAKNTYYSSYRNYFCFLEQLLHQSISDFDKIHKSCSYVPAALSSGSPGGCMGKLQRSQNQGLLPTVH